MPNPLSAHSLLASACASDDKLLSPDDGVPCVASTAAYSVLVDSDVTYAEALAHNNTSTARSRYRSSSTSTPPTRAQRTDRLHVHSRRRIHGRNEDA